MSLPQEDRILTQFFGHQTQIKMFHFQTKKWGAHKASDAYLCKFGANFDRFMEVYQGAYKKVQTPEIKVNLQMLNDENIVQNLAEFVKWLKAMDSAQDNALSEQPGLLAIRDEMVADVQQLIYLLRDFS
jgi:hypothetical protein